MENENNKKKTAKKIIIIVLILVVLIVLALYIYNRVKTNQTTDTVDTATIENVHESLDSYPINAEVIIRNGVMVDEYYKDGYDENSVFTLQSTSKSVTSAILGIAIDKGYIEGVDVPISTYFPQILESGSEYKNQITIWHLLTHTTGLEASDTANETLNEVKNAMRINYFIDKDFINKYSYKE